MSRAATRGFTLVEVLVALMVVTLGLAALMVAVSGAARTSGFLRDKTMAQWIALNRITEVRLNLNKFAQNTDTGELDFANRKWHYDTRYFDTSISTMRRVVVRVYLGDAKTKGNAIVETVGFLGTAMAAPGGSNVDWTTGTLPQATPGTIGTTPTTTTPPTTAPAPTTTNPTTTPTSTTTP